MESRSSSRRTLAGALVVVLVTGVARPTLAQPAEDEVLLRAGVEHRRSGRDAEALDAFRRALAVRRTPRALAQVALAEQALSLWLEAEEHLDQALREDADPWIKQNRAALEGAARLVAGKLAWLSVRSNVSDATLLVGGRPAGVVSSQARVRAVAGQVVVELRRPSGAAESRSVLLVPAQEAQVSIDFPPDKAPPAPAAPPPTAEPAGSLRGTVGIVAVGAGVIGLGLGTGFGLHAASLKRERDADCEGGCTEAGVTADRDGRSAATVSTVAFAAGAGLATLGLVLVLTVPRTGTRVAVSAAPGSLRLEGRF